MAIQLGKKKKKPIFDIFVQSCLGKYLYKRLSQMDKKTRRLEDLSEVSGPRYGPKPNSINVLLSCSCNISKMGSDIYGSCSSNT
jgi:hypothetical protein